MSVYLERNHVSSGISEVEITLTFYPAVPQVQIGLAKQRIIELKRTMTKKVGLRLELI